MGLWRWRKGSTIYMIDTISKASISCVNPKNHKGLQFDLRAIPAVCCCTLPRVEDPINAILECVYAEADPFWASPRKMVDDEYMTFEFPFEPVEGAEHTGPFEFDAKQSMNLDEYVTYIRSWSAHQTARKMAFELLREEFGRA